MADEGKAIVGKNRESHERNVSELTIFLTGHVRSNFRETSTKGAILSEKMQSITRRFIDEVRR